MILFEVAGLEKVWDHERVDKLVGLGWHQMGADRHQLVIFPHLHEALASRAGGAVALYAAVAAPSRWRVSVHPDDDR